MQLAGWHFKYHTSIDRVKTLLAQVWCKGPTCWKSLAAFGRECLQFHCEVRNPFSSTDTTPSAQELSWQGADCEASKAGDQVRPIPSFLTSHLGPSRDLTWYPISSVLTAWELLLAAAPQLSHQPSYLYDLVDVTRQVSVMCYTSTVQHLHRPWRTLRQLGTSAQRLHTGGGTWRICISKPQHSSKYWKTWIESLQRGQSSFWDRGLRLPR